MQINHVRQITNADGETTDVIVPIELWQKLVSSINSDSASGLAWMDECQPKSQILADLQDALQQAALGQTYPISELWDDISA